MNLRWLHSFFARAAFPVMLVALAGPALPPAAGAQAGAAGTPPAGQAAPQQGAPDQSQQTAPYKITTSVRLVTTPVTVFDSVGQFVYDLDQNEFKIYDNGQLQHIAQFDSEIRRLALVIVVETNENTAPFLPYVQPLGSMFSQMVMGPQGEVAVLTYSDHVEMPLGFTSNGDKLDTVLRGLRGRSSGMHLDDALARALSMLDSRPREDRKVAIIFSDGFDIGSQMSRSEIVKRAMNSDITIYGMGFSPMKGLWARPVKDPPPDLVSQSVARSMPPNSVPTPTLSSNTYDTPIPMAAILLGLGEQGKKLIFKSSLQYYARYSGGDFFEKWGKDTVQEALNRIASEIHSQYELAYAPTTPIQPGFHKIEVQVRRPGARVRARAGWFYQGEPVPGQKVK